MAGIEHRPGDPTKGRPDAWKVYWRTGGRGAPQTAVTFHDEGAATRAKKLVEAHNGRITREQVEDAILDLPPLDPADNQPASTAPTLDDWYPEWIASRTRPGPAMLRRYQQYFTRSILPALGHLHLDELHDRDIARWLNGLRAPTDRCPTGRKGTTVTRYYAALHACLRAATKAGIIDHNPCDALDFRRDEVAHHDTGDDDKPRVFLTPDQYRRLRGEVPKVHQALLDVLVGTGMRWSEGTALDVAKVDRAPQHGRPRMVHVVRAWKVGADGKRYLGTTKGRKKRSVPPPSWLLPVLDELLGDRRKGFLLRTPAGEPYEYSSFLHRVWQPAVLAAMRCPTHRPADRGIPVPEGVDPGRWCRDWGGLTDKGQPCGHRLVPGLTRCAWHRGPQPGAVSDCECPDVLREAITPHDLRHTYASWLIYGGENPRVVQERLGHESITTTEIYFALLQPGSEASTVSALDKVWKGEDRAQPAKRPRSRVGS